MYKGKEYNDLWVILQNMSRSHTEMIPDKYMEYNSEENSRKLRAEAMETMRIVTGG